jgi:hypothetical protein
LCLVAHILKGILLIYRDHPFGGMNAYNPIA